MPPSGKQQKLRRKKLELARQAKTMKDKENTRLMEEEREVQDQKEAKEAVQEEERREEEIQKREEEEEHLRNQSSKAKEFWYDIFQKLEKAKEKFALFDKLMVEDFEKMTRAQQHRGHLRLRNLTDIVQMLHEKGVPAGDMKEIHKALKEACTENAKKREMCITYEPWPSFATMKNLIEVYLDTGRINACGSGTTCTDTIAGNFA